MVIEVKRLTKVSEDLAAAFARLLPQLSESLTAPTIERIGQIVADERTALFVAAGTETNVTETDAAAGSRIVGMLLLTWYDVASGRKAWIEDVVVDSSARGRGAGRELVRAAIEHARLIGASKVMLTSSPRREAARALYLKMGFEAAETTLFVHNNR